jgi:hypothetical protein
MIHNSWEANSSTTQKITLIYIWAQQWVLSRAWWIKSVSSYPVSCKLHFIWPSRLRKLPLSGFQVIILYAFRTFPLRATRLWWDTSTFKATFYAEDVLWSFTASLSLQAPIRSQDNPADWLGIWFRFQAGAQVLSSPQRGDGLWAPCHLVPSGCRGSLPEGKRVGM